MRPERMIFCVGSLFFLLGCPGGGTVPTGDATGTDSGAKADGTAAEVESDAGLEVVPDTMLQDDASGAFDAADWSDSSPDDATVFELPLTPCQNDEECEAVFGESSECLRIFCNLFIGACGIEPAPDGSPCTLTTRCEEDGLCQAGRCRGNPITCDDENPCTDDTCDPAVGCVFTNNSAACDDGNECTTDDRCHEGRCVGIPACGCTSDADCLPFEDGDLCNGRLRCEDATCVVDPATVIHCEPPAGKPCLSAKCVPETGMCAVMPAPDGSACDDGNGCTVQDRCVNGDCTGMPRVCDDHNPCTADSCDPKSGGCVFVPANDGKPCSDGNLCTTGDVCSGGKCAGTPKTCDDGNPCTDDSCDPKTGACVFTPNTAACDDQNACTVKDTCQGGQCVGEPKVCDDVNSCTADSCDPAVGCVFVPANDGKPCSDGNLCTTGDVCSGGKCTGTPKTCDDGNPCTDDSCDPKTGACVFTPNTAACDDQNLCTVKDTCQGGQCVGEPKVCDDVNSCTADSCDPAVGCVFVPANDGKKCSDGNACTTNDVCSGGKCIGTPKTCDDGNPCTDDSCDKKTGACVFTPNTAACDDQNLCTVKDTCQGGQCVGEPKVCDDVNSCTADSCDPAVGCVFVPANDGKTCSDGNLCTTGDVCSGGKCVGTPKVCDDGNPCTDDSCDKKTGCVFTPNTAACDDQDACTTGDACSNGTCRGSPVVCNDQNECTTDTCDPTRGCVFTPVPNWPPVFCDGQFHVCWNGQCVGLPGGP